MHSFSTSLPSQEAERNAAWCRTYNILRFPRQQKRKKKEFPAISDQPRMPAEAVKETQKHSFGLSLLLFSLFLWRENNVLKLVRATQKGKKVTGANWTEAQLIFFSRVFPTKKFNSFFPSAQNFETIPHVNDGNVGYFGGSVALADYCPYIQVHCYKNFNLCSRNNSFTYLGIHLALQQRGCSRLPLHVQREQPE